MKNVFNLVFIVSILIFVIVGITIKDININQFTALIYLISVSLLAIFINGLINKIDK